MTRRSIALTSTAAVLAVAVGVAACGVPTGPDSFEVVDPDAVPEVLTAEATTTTTTTTVPAPSTSVPPESPETTLATTTMPLVPTEAVSVFFVSRGRLTSVETVAPIAPEPLDLILLLERGPEGPLAGLLDNLVEEGLIVETSRAAGVLTVELDEREFERIANRDEVEAIGQIVLTFLATLNGIGQVAFTIDGAPLTVPTAAGVFTDQPVSGDDYTSLLADGVLSSAEPPETTTTTTTSTTTTTVPATTAPSSTLAPS